jgi:hypothetical protein
MNASPGQIRKIWAMAHQLGFDSEILHYVLKHNLNLDSISRLTRTNARKFIDLLNHIAGEDRPGYRASEKIDQAMREEGMTLGCTPAQLDKIRYLLRDVGWNDERVKGYLGSLKITRIEELSRTLASNFIEYLKSEKRRVICTGKSISTSLSPSS